MYFEQCLLYLIQICRKLCITLGMGFSRGDVVAVDFGMQAKARPAVVVSIPKADRQRNMSVVVPMTTEIRNGESEVSIPQTPLLEENAVLNILRVATLAHNTNAQHPR